MSRLWPGVTPHPSGCPGSVWDLEYHVWLMFARLVDDYAQSLEEAAANG